MAYIGKQPTIGNFVKLDAIVTSATATYNLLNGGVAYSPQSANHCIVSLNGVIQSPTTSFTISGSTIVFASALTASDVIDFILVLGDVLNIGTPSDNTVSLAKLTATGTKDATTFLRGDNTFASAGGANTPAFSAYKTGNQTLTAATYTKIQVSTERFDTNSNYDNATNYRFTPTTAGKYLLIGTLAIDTATNTFNNIAIYKNGSIAIENKYFIDSGALDSGNYGLSISGILEANGSTDYFELYGFCGSARNVLGGEEKIQFSGMKVIT